MSDESSVVVSLGEGSEASKCRTSAVDHEGQWDLFGNHAGPCFHSKEVFS